ncbi:hypothetical protein ABG775_09280 [Peribacillus simplex]|uniref:hypothetical protein n=1 Tax=Peribacillus TaxID=2675229 RepID=UPI00177E2DC9|nr:hypothetical protein [Brevibacillus sp. JNUCC-41]QOS88667.1 hypothetical protein JNUCC41_17790 [Brevibacillus sp. JNUCC-41]
MRRWKIEKNSISYYPNNIFIGGCSHETVTSIEKDNRFDKLNAEIAEIKKEKERIIAEKKAKEEAERKERE